MWQALGLLCILVVSCLELCNVNGTMKVLNGYTPDVRGSPNPLYFCIGGAGTRDCVVSTEVVRPSSGQHRKCEELGDRKLQLISIIMNEMLIVSPS